MSTNYAALVHGRIRQELHIRGILTAEQERALTAADWQDICQAAVVPAPSALLLEQEGDEARARRREPPAAR